MASETVLYREKGLAGTRAASRFLDGASALRDQFDCLGVHLYLWWVAAPSGLAETLEAAGLSVQMPRKRLVGQSGGAAVWGFVEDPSRLEATLHKFWNGSERPEIAIAAAVTSPDPAGIEQEAAASETRGAASIRMIDEDCFEVRPPEALESLASQS